MSLIHAQVRGSSQFVPSSSQFVPGRTSGEGLSSSPWGGSVPDAPPGTNLLPQSKGTRIKTLEGPQMTEVRPDAQEPGQGLDPELVRALRLLVAGGLVDPTDHDPTRPRPEPEAEPEVGVDRRTWGPCLGPSCESLTPRYGVGGSPLCPTCSEALAARQGRGTGVVGLETCPRCHRPVLGATSGQEHVLLDALHVDNGTETLSVASDRASYQISGDPPRVRRRDLDEWETEWRTSTRPGVVVLEHWCGDVSRLVRCPACGRRTLIEIDELGRELYREHYSSALWICPRSGTEVERRLGS